MLSYVVSLEMSTRKCLNNPNVFSYICGNYIIAKQKQDSNSFVRNVYYAYFGIRLGDEDKSWAPHKVCRTFVERLRLWKNGAKKPMEGATKSCMINVEGHNAKSKKDIQYPNIPSLYDQSRIVNLSLSQFHLPFLKMCHRKAAQKMNTIMLMITSRKKILHKNYSVKMNLMI